MNQADLEAIFKAFSSSVRLKILELLLEKRMCVSKIVLELNITQPSITQHLKILKSIGLVKSKKLGYWVHYAINKDGLQEIKEKLQQFLDSLIIHEKKCDSAPDECPELTDKV